MDSCFVLDHPIYPLAMDEMHPDTIHRHPVPHFSA
jgi:hypothetical protein